MATPLAPEAVREAEVRQMLIDTLRDAASRMGHRKVFLFGSRALGKAKDRSDFDLGVMGDEPMPLEDFYAVEDLFEALPTLYRVDWVDLARVEAILSVRPDADPRSGISGAQSAVEGQFRRGNGNCGSTSLPRTNNSQNYQLNHIKALQNVCRS